MARRGSDARAKPPLKRFTILPEGGYEDIRKALLRRGWEESQQKPEQDKAFDLLWALKAKDVPHRTLKPHQVVNHFERVDRALTTKQGLAASLRDLPMLERVDADAFFPRSFDLSVPEEYAAFEADFKWGAAEGVVKRALRDGALRPDGVPDLDTLRAALQVCATRVRFLHHLSEDVDGPPTHPSDEPATRAATPAEPEVATPSDGGAVEVSTRGGEGEPIPPDERAEAEKLLRRLSERHHVKQAHMDGECNAWILKPARKSRGRGIQLFNSLKEIREYTVSGERAPEDGSTAKPQPKPQPPATPSQQTLAQAAVLYGERKPVESGPEMWVAQRYIERPLMVLALGVNSTSGSGYSSPTGPRSPYGSTVTATSASARRTTTCAS